MYVRSLCIELLFLFGNTNCWKECFGSKNVRYKKGTKNVRYKEWIKILVEHVKRCGLWCCCLHCFCQYCSQGAIKWKHICLKTYLQTRQPTLIYQNIRKHCRLNGKNCSMYYSASEPDSHPTPSTEWARRAHSMLVRLACVHILWAKKVSFFKISSWTISDLLFFS